MITCCPKCKTEYDISVPGKYQCSVCEEKFIVAEQMDVDDFDKTIASPSEHMGGVADDVTKAGMRNQKPDGRFSIGSINRTKWFIFVLISLAVCISGVGYYIYETQNPDRVLNKTCVASFYAGDYEGAWKTALKIENKSSDVELILGYFYRHGMQLCEINDEIAFDYFRKSAKRGNAIAKYYLADSLKNGRGCAKKVDLAEQLFENNFSKLKKLAEKNNVLAQYKLGVCYFRGYGLIRDYAEAVKWYRKAAEQGYADAQESLGYCYAIGFGVTRDDAKAIRWYRKAAEQGNADAQFRLGGRL